jgi:DNA-binding response OmpR family regulator
MPHHTILLAEADQAVNQMICTCLEGEGYAVLSVNNGEDALAIYDASPAKIALVIADAGLPKMSGIELRNILRMRDPAIKIMLLSGGLPATQGVNLNLGVHDRFVPKPFILEAFLTHIEEFL